MSRTRYFAVLWICNPTPFRPGPAPFKLSKSNKKPSEDFPGRVLKLYTYSHKILVSGTLPSHIFLKFANKVSHFSPLFCFNLDELFACFLKKIKMHKGLLKSSIIWFIYIIYTDSLYMSTIIFNFLLYFFTKVGNLVVFGEVTRRKYKNKHSVSLYLDTILILSVCQQSSFSL